MQSQRMKNEIHDPAWQSRNRSPSDREYRLAEALEAILSEGIHDLEGIVSALNTRGIPSPDGSSWIAETFRLEIEQLADGNGLLWQPPPARRAFGAVAGQQGWRPCIG